MMLTTILLALGMLGPISITNGVGTCEGALVDFDRVEIYRCSAGTLIGAGPLQLGNDVELEWDWAEHAGNGTWIIHL
jgi:hypothetical protein